MEPPCLPGECYLYAVDEKEHAESNRAVADDPAVARALVGESVPFRRGPYTETEPWDRTKLGLVNALLDTLIPGARLVVTGDDPPRAVLGRTTVWARPRDLARSLRDLADCLDLAHPPTPR